MEIRNTSQDGALISNSKLKFFSHRRRELAKMKMEKNMIRLAFEKASEKSMISLACGSSKAVDISSILGVQNFVARTYLNSLQSNLAQIIGCEQ